LLCGYLSEDVPLAGGLYLRRDLAEAAMQPIAATLNADTTHAAESVIAVATSNMLANALPFIARLGIEPRELTLMIYGGAGAIHGPLLADEIGIGRVVVPRVSSVFCAFGCLVSDLLYDVVRTVHGIALSPELIRDTYAALREEGRSWLAAQSTDIVPAFEHAADVRYAGQSFEVNTPIDETTTREGDPTAIAVAFHAQHQRLYGHADPAAHIEILGLRVRVRGPLPRPPAIPAAAQQAVAKPAGKRRARFNRGWHETPIYRWSDLPPGWRATGPAIVEQETATVVIPPDFTVSLGPFGDLVLQRMR
ncbi:MAG: hydantoinase/oxoprolinase family protein, partial [Acetobacteraceae bacterium]